MKFVLTNHENKNVIQFKRGLETMLMEHVYEFAFAGSVKRKLTNAEIYAIVKNDIMESMMVMLDSDQDFLPVQE